MHFELSALIVWIALWIVNTYYKFQVNIFTINRDITKCQSFCTTTKSTDKDDAKAMAIPRDFSENSHAKNREKFWFIVSMRRLHRLTLVGTFRKCITSLFIKNMTDWIGHQTSTTLVTSRPIPYLHQTSSVFMRSPIKLLSVWNNLLNLQLRS